MGAVRVAGELHERLMLNFNRLERADYEPKAAFNERGWPGDYPGRLILALSHLVGTSGRTAKYLDQLITQLPQHLNEQGYHGQVCTYINEQQLSGHGWLVSGLVQYFRLTGDSHALDMADRVCSNLFSTTSRTNAQLPAPS